MNTQFDKALSAFVSVDKKTVNAFGTLSAFAYSIVKEVTGDGETVKNVLKNAFTAEETAFRTANPKAEAFPGTYRSAKSTLLSAVAAGVSLVDAKGNALGKSELEELTKATKDEKSDVQKFETAIGSASKIFAKVDGLDDIRKCKALMLVLADAVVKAEASAKGAEHREKAPLSADDKAFIAAELMAKAIQKEAAAAH
jgi:hypothetical protein